MAGVFTAGIDVSHWQGTIKWDKVAKADIKFVLMKASESTKNTDSKFTTNWKGCRAAGIRCGAYHFFRPSVDGKLQAENLLSQLKKANFGKKGDLIPTLDCEDFDGSSKSKYRDELQACLDRIQSEIGSMPMIYTLRSFWMKIGNPDFSKYPLWVVDLSAVDSPKLPKPWTDYVVWQHTFTGSVSGIPGEVDRDRFNGDLKELDKIGA